MKYCMIECVGGGGGGGGSNADVGGIATAGGGGGGNYSRKISTSATIGAESNCDQWCCWNCGPGW